MNIEKCLKPQPRYDSSAPSFFNIRTLIQSNSGVQPTGISEYLPISVFGWYVFLSYCTSVSLEVKPTIKALQSLLFDFQGFRECVGLFAGCLPSAIHISMHIPSGTNISHQKSFLKLIFLFPRWDMSVPWRVMLPLIFPTFLILSNTLPFCWIFQPNFFPQQHVPRRKISRHKEARPCSWREPHWNLRFASSAGMRQMYHPQPQINRPKKQPAFLSPHLPVP